MPIPRHARARAHAHLGGANRAGWFVHSSTVSMILSSVKHSDVQCREPLVRNLPPSLLVSVLALVLVLVYGRVVRALIHGVYDTEQCKTFGCTVSRAP